MKRIAALLLTACLLLAGCGGNSDELVVEVQRQATAASTIPATIEVTVPTTLPATEPTTIPTTAPTEIPTEEPTELLTESLAEPSEEPTEAEPENLSSAGQDYVLNKNTKKFHYPYCSSVSRMKVKNRWDYWGSREEILSMGYVPCKICNP